MILYFTDQTLYESYIKEARVCFLWALNLEQVIVAIFMVEDCS